ncbi:MAG: DNA polymerase III subunit gamma/tau [Alphaproteobacteria bacterium]|nr:DNA polymerase III subunit gamma/tau [Alphaproteobacteria bacterium]
MAENNQKQENYVVLARKYRPQDFNELLGQDALVQTLTNAIRNNRLHHAYILTGIRGVGKTTTARIIAKALNCIGKDSREGPTINPCGICENCRAIAESRHIDVLELDAASRTGVDDMREILDGVRYKPTNGNYKIYIIDEVHMLSKSAFNALLKTLEEPPSHVIFIFATTEIRKVPITVLSRCQRFDLQRLSIDTLIGHFKNILSKEGLQAEDEALHMIAKAADGSCRDGLSLLDQAISLGSGTIKTDVVKNMIGLADRNQTFDLFEKLVSGDINKTVAILDEMYKNGATPLTTLQDLVNITHMIAKAKIVPTYMNDDSLSENEKDLCAKLSSTISIAVLSKIWQMMIKGLGELNTAPVQIDALEMILIRIAYSASLPTPSELLHDVKKNSNLRNVSLSAEQAPAPVFTQPVAPANQTANSKESANGNINTPEELLAYLENSKKILLSYSLKNDLSFNSFCFGKMSITVSDKINNDFLLNLQNVLIEATGQKWDIEIQRGQLGETIADKEQAQDNANKKSVSDLPLVKAILAEFNGAKIETLTRKIHTEEKSEISFEDNNNYFDEDL